jgi:hypothetical protein
VGEGEHFEPVLEKQIDDVEGKVVNRSTPDCRIVDPGNASAGIRKLLDQLERRSRLPEESIGSGGAAPPVPREGFLKLSIGPGRMRIDFTR